MRGQPSDVCSSPTQLNMRLMACLRLWKNGVSGKCCVCLQLDLLEFPQQNKSGKDAATPRMYLVFCTCARLKCQKSLMYLQPIFDSDDAWLDYGIIWTLPNHKTWQSQQMTRINGRRVESLNF